MEAQALTRADRDRPTRKTDWERTPRRRLWADRGATWVVTAGGMAIIAGILGILVFIVVEIFPLLLGATVRDAGRVALSREAAGAVVTDEHRTHAALLTRGGTLEIVRLADGRPVLERDLSSAAPLRLVRAHAAPGRQLLIGASDDGRLAAVPVAWEVSFLGDERQVAPRPGETIVFAMDPGGRAVGAHAVRVDDDGAALAAAQLEDGTVVFLWRDVAVHMLTGEVEERWRRDESFATTRLTCMVLDDARRNLFAGAADGTLLWWQLGGASGGAPQVVPSANGGVTALTFLIGDRSLVAGHEDGTISIWFPVRQEDEGFVLTRIRDFPPHPGPVRLLAPSTRDKSFLALDATGVAGLYHSTSHRTLWRGPAPVADAAALSFAPKGDGAVLAGGRELARLDIDNPHPELSLTALFGKVWYEGYERPVYAWQSTGGTDDFEPKLSLTPLLVGTLKGTLYSLFLAIPLGVLGAMYTSQFVHPALKRYVKPTVEIMAALPSVVLGFLAGLWLAPRLEQLLPALLLINIVCPVLVLLVGYAWRRVPPGLRPRAEVGAELLLYGVVVALAVAGCVAVEPWFERVAFGGDVQAWLLEATGLQYDQRNALVVGLAMGFAVIPIIFSISEDAFSNVPRSLVSGSLALGANRWQTVTRVVLPTASPGIFSAILIGFGRAIGETMIVLMATGNTPILDWNPFNGFRTLSANVAVEIPEAPFGGTLYRTLFLAALLLFLLTFAVNTAGDVVRQRLRKRYANL
jgi:phosphate transport system permease protein